jgi:hypothetical protein
MHRRIRVQGPWLLASAIILGLLISSFAVAAGEGTPILGGKRNPGSNGSVALSQETEIIANNSSYGTRQSNKSDNGGGAIYGCRSKAGGTPKGNNPCIRSSNLADGRAFEFEAKGGTEVGTITSSNSNAAPFTTNARGVATGLNADQVDGKSADELQADALKAAQAADLAQTKFAAIAADGKLGGTRGATAAARTADGSYTVTFADDISACALSATEQVVDDAGAVGVQLGADKKTVTVRTRTGGGVDGTAATAVADRPFHLVVNC